MSYQVLARKYRPKSFTTLVGQEHVVRALTHALEQQRLHHAYLFTGTRGVGKTTLSRILAKSFNCEKGITANACGECEACTAIDAGRFVDYIEMDAASNRGVDEMASLLEQAIYAPSNARFKVYMIDEVHMLTNHAFNAMLKTLEEPPPHVKFILATTDPQKIPVTVLSRCLQFNLKQMPPGHIVGHLENILGQERIDFEVSALRLLAQGAHGSMRDALSLTDQAIAYAAGKVSLDAVQSMLGALDQSYLIRLLDALVAEDGEALLAVADEMAARSLSYKSALQDLSTMLHQISIAQLVPKALAEDVPEREALVRLAQQFDKEEVQLYYQIAVHGRNELGLAPDEYAGFSMALLRMLAFRPGRLPPLGPHGGGGAPTTIPRATGPVPHSAREAMQLATSTKSAVANVAPAPNPIRNAADQGSADTKIQSSVPPAPIQQSAPEPAPAPQTVAEKDEFAGIRLPPAVNKVVADTPLQQSAAPSKMSPAMAALAAARAASSKGGAVVAPNKFPVQSSTTAEIVSVPVAPAANEQSNAQQVKALVAEPIQDARSAEVHGAIDTEVDLPPWDEGDFAELSSSNMPPAKQKDLDEADYFHEAGADASSMQSQTPAAVVSSAPAAPIRPLAPLQLIPIKEIEWDGHWPNLANTLSVKGVAQQLALQSELRQCTLNGGAIVFRLCVPVQTLLSAGSVDKLVAALEERFGQFGFAIRVETEVGAVEQTANAQAQAEKAARQQQAERAIQEDSFVQTLMREFGATILAGSVRPA